MQCSSCVTSLPVVVCRLLSGRAQLPSPAEMQSEVDAFYKQLLHEGLALRYAHMLSDDQWEYNDWLAEAAGPDVQPLSAWRPAMYKTAGINKRTHPDDYRDRYAREPWCSLLLQTSLTVGAALNAVLAGVGMFVLTESSILFGALCFVAPVHCHFRNQVYFQQ